MNAHVNIKRRDINQIRLYVPILLIETQKRAFEENFPNESKARVSLTKITFNIASCQGRSSTVMLKCFLGMLNAH